jgi:hypothetical protein
MAGSSPRLLREEKPVVLSRRSMRAREENMTLEHRRYFGLSPSCAPVLNLSPLSRRRFVAGAVAVSAFAATGSTFASKAQAQPRPYRIDVHHHISPPTWLNAMKKANLDNPPMANWSVQKTLDDIDKGGVATAITSPTTPQLPRSIGSTSPASRASRKSTPKN